MIVPILTAVFATNCIQKAISNEHTGETWISMSSACGPADGNATYCKLHLNDSGTSQSLVAGGFPHNEQGGLYSVEFRVTCHNEQGLGPAALFIRSIHNEQGGLNVTFSGYAIPATTWETVTFTVDQYISGDDLATISVRFGAGIATDADAKISIDCIELITTKID